MKNQDIPSLDEVRKAISFQSSDIDDVPTSGQPPDRTRAARSVRAKAPADVAVGAKLPPEEGAKSVRAKLPPGEGSLPVARARLPPEDVIPPTEEELGDGSDPAGVEEDVSPPRPIRAKLPQGEGTAKPISRARLPPDEDAAIPVVRASLPPEDIDEQSSNEEVIPMVVRAKLPPDEDVAVEDLQPPVRAKVPGGTTRPLRARLPPDEEPIPVVRARPPPEDIEEQVSIPPTEEVIPVVRAKLPIGDNIGGVSKPARSKLLGTGGGPLRAKLPPDEDAIPASLPPEDIEGQSNEEVIPMVVRAKLPPDEDVAVEDMQPPVRAKVPGGATRPLRARLPPDEEPIPVVRARPPPEDIEGQSSVSPTEEAVPVVRAKLPSGRGVQQVPRPTKAKLPSDENSSSPQSKVVRSKLAQPSTNQDDVVPKPRPGSAQSQASLLSAPTTPLSSLQKPPRNVSSPNLQQSGPPTPRGPKQPTAQPTRRVSPLTPQQSSPSPPPLQQVQPSLSPSHMDGEMEQVGPKGKVTATSRLPSSSSPSSKRSPAARGLPAPSSQRPLVAKGEGSGSSPGPAPFSPSNLKVSSRPSSQSKVLASPSNQQKRVVSTPSSKYGKLPCQPADSV